VAALVDLTLFRSRAFAVGSLAGMAFGLVPSAFFFVLALYLQQGRGYSALFSGAVLAAAGALTLAWQAHAGSAWALVPGLVLVGFGIGAVLVPLSSAVLAGVDARLAGAAAGVLATAQQVGGAVGVAVIGVAFFAAGSVVHGFVVSLCVVAGLTVLTAVLAQLSRPAR